jgi:outer membrane protein insertion porin family
MEVSKLRGFNDKINLSFSVEEAKTGTFSVGLSNSNSTGASFNLGIEEKNFLGTGNTLNASTSQSKAVKKLNIYFSNPYFTKDKHSISYGIFNKKTEGSELKVEEYKVNEKGGSIGYGIPITKDTRIGVVLRLSSRKITCGTTFSGVDYEQAQCSSNDKTEAKLSNQPQEHL